MTEKVTLDDLAGIIAARSGTDPESSYTARLLDRGAAQCAKKFGEEAVELVIAAMEGDRKSCSSEAADVLYHFAVLLSAAGIDLDMVYADLGRRTGQSGLQEKASRKS